MSLFDPSGSAFYVEPAPESLEETSPQEQMAQDSQSFAAADTVEVKGTPVTPPYTRFNEAGEDTFAPLPQTGDPSFQPSSQPPQQPVQATGFQFQPWMLLAAGAALVLYLRSEK